VLGWGSFERPSAEPRSFGTQGSQFVRQNRLAISLTALAVLACLVAGVVLSQVPIMRGGRRPELGEIAGMVAVPAIGAAVATWAAWRNRPVVLSIGAAVVGLFSFVTGFSIGRLFLPAAGLLVWGVVASLGSGPAQERSAR
jgi:hypothetical protein